MHHIPTGSTLQPLPSIQPLPQPHDPNQTGAYRPLPYGGHPVGPAAHYSSAPTGLASPPLQSLSIKRTASQTPLVDESPQKKTTKWTQEEDELTVELRGAGMKWEDISKRIPGRSAISCRLRYQNYLEKRAHWDEEKKNKLARLYVRFKEQMWQRVASEMGVPWRSAEAMHWTLGPDEIANRANQPVFQLNAAATAGSGSASTSPHAQPPMPANSYHSHPQMTSPPYATALYPAGSLGGGFGGAGAGRTEHVLDGRRRADSGSNGQPPPMPMQGYTAAYPPPQQRPPTSEGYGSRPYSVQVEYTNPPLKPEMDQASQRSYGSSGNGNSHEKPNSHPRTGSRNGEDRQSQGSRGSPRSIHSAHSAHSAQSARSGHSNGSTGRGREGNVMRQRMEVS